MATNYEKYFGTPEKAAMTLCDLDAENQSVIRKALLHSMDFRDESRRLLPENQLREEAANYATNHILLLFEYMRTPDGSPKEYTYKPTGAHDIFEWLQEECDE